MERIGVIGLGRMGSAIARRMAAEGRVVSGWTRSGRAVDGVPAAADLVALVAASDVLVLSLLDDAAVAEVLDALVARDLTGKLVIDTSTVTPTVLGARIEALRAKGAEAVDAPISGGPELVLAGACGVFVGGDAEPAARAEAVLAAISGRIFHVGPLGAGLVMKTINNSMLQTYVAGLADLLPVARKAGLPLATVMNILNGGPAGMPMIRDRLPRILGEDSSVGFDIRSTFKDNRIFQNVLAAYGESSPTLARYLAQEGPAEAAGLGEADLAALVRFAYEGA